MTKLYSFEVLLWGEGETALEAWQHAVEGFKNNPGELDEDETKILEDLDAGDDLCDHCMRSGVQITYTDANGNTMCDECAREAHLETYEEDN